ncbi:hypothetical protein TRSC58_07618 [Trypanosoma rangeli SC58]|uniref:Uncharacterized protein n=1 Tax=Trypanosoma rangeli SC58 TaxID=429131 RepID=A0A061IUV2_TRYRA|nr:hypothetical protein TRSC58_07618 [Trypanosoma rangeli SC58]
MGAAAAARVTWRRSNGTSSKVSCRASVSPSLLLPPLLLSRVPHASSWTLTATPTPGTPHEEALAVSPLTHAAYVKPLPR